jgi:hypothetical protein
VNIISNPRGPGSGYNNNNNFTFEIKYMVFLNGNNFFFKFINNYINNNENNIYL